MRMPTPASTIVFAAAVLFAAPSLADERAGRYSMSPTDGGFLRLDTDTGAVSICTKKAEQWACEPLKDNQSSLAGELEKLKAENKALKDEIKRMEEVFALGGQKPGGEAGPPGGRPGGKFDLPSEKDVDKAFDYLEGMMKKFKERFKRLEQQEKPGQQL